jgi:signal transduction histidine kinase/CheY-like chemotaxis protein
MRERLPLIQCGIFLGAVFLLCLFTGGVDSLARFLFYPLIAFLSWYVPSQQLLATGLTFSMLFPVLFVVTAPATNRLPSLLVETSAFFVTTIAAAYLAKRLHQERFRYENAVATFHSLSNELSHKNMNLQTALEALSEANRKLEDFDRKKTEFLSNVSHELRTPLSSIRSYSEILLNYDDIAVETQREFLQIINKESERLAGLVTEVLDLIRIESGKQELVFATVDPRQLLEESVKIIRPMLQDKGLSLEWAACALPGVRGDRNQLLQVLVNLLNNAVKFTSQGTITVGARQVADAVEFFVADTGEGVFPEEQEHIFEPFSRIAEHAVNRPSGSGLGLSISRSIVEFHGGRIWVDSEVGRGSTFTFSIPLAEKGAPRREVTGLSGRQSTMAAYWPVLVVTSDVVCRRALRKRLEGLGYQTLGADAPERALDIISQMRPGLIVAEAPESWDVFTGLVNGAREAGIRVLFTTLHVEGSEDPCLAVHGYIARPYDRYEIASLLEQYQVRNGPVLIISPDQDEARNLQVLLGAIGFGATLFQDWRSALPVVRESNPVGIVIGSFRKYQLVEIISGLHAVIRGRDIPVFEILGTTLSSSVTPVAISAVSRTTGKDSIYRLVGEIETEYSRLLE